ncbi:MAG: class B sortase [Clostridia bacterium]|nr:class B sortase [Clostridia bacterium]
MAWLKIPGTNVDYPVVLSDNTAYYLTHSFTGKQSKLGTLFSLNKTDYQTPGRNIAIYGHHITNTCSGELMFRPLLSFKKKTFYENHSVIYLDSLYHTGIYKVFAVVNLVKGEWDPSTASFASDADFLAFIRQAQARSLYDTGVEVTSADRILTLITCDRSYAAADGRLIVLAVEQ